MGVSIRLPECDSPQKRRRRRLASRRLLTAVLLAAVFLLFWVLGGVPWTDEDSRVGTQPSGSTEPAAVVRDPGDVMVGVNNLVIVTCHAIWLGGPTAGENESEWAIESFQKGETATFIQHIEKGVEIALGDPESLLVFSGGETKASVGPRSEADGYFDLAASRNLLPPSLLARTTTEESATDSYQNVLFSIARFHETTGIYPLLVTVISHDFKRDRFRQLHRASIRYPEERFRFVGIDPDWEKKKTASIKAAVLESEGTTRSAWETDPYACARNGELETKRRGRNPWRRFNSYTASCPELAGLLGWCASHLYPGTLPW